MDNVEQKHRIEEVLTIARQRLEDDRVQKKMGFRGELMILAAKMAQAADIEDGRVVPFPGYEKKNRFPIISLAEGDEVITTMTAPLPLQQDILRANICRSWDEQGLSYSNEEVEHLLAMGPNDAIIFRYEPIALGLQNAARNIRMHKTDEGAPYLLRFGRPHIVIQDIHCRKPADLADTAVHELSHAVDAIVDPLLLVPSEELRHVRLKGELAAYATQLIVHRTFRSKTEAIFETLFPKMSDMVELSRVLINGPYTSENAFEPNRKIERTLGALGLSRIY